MRFTLEEKYLIISALVCRKHTLIKEIKSETLNPNSFKQEELVKTSALLEKIKNKKW